MDLAYERKWCRLNKSFLLLAAIFANTAFGISLEWRLSRVHGLVNFAETIAGDQNRSRTLREIFERSPQMTSTLSAVERFKKARARLDTGWAFSGFPADRGVGQTLEKLLLVQSAFAADLEDFSRRAQGLMPAADLAAYVTALKGIEPIYDVLVWTPSLAKLQTLRDKLAEQAKGKDFSSLFARAAVFYRARWPESVPMTVALHPIPGARGESSAESLDGVQSMGLLIDRDAEGDELGILFHEVSHSLYEAQTMEFQQEWETYFRNTPSESSEPAYVLINEALATALGNGWAQEKLGTPRTGTWYDDPSIDTFAHQLYPLVKTYVEGSRPLDKEFAQKAITVLERAIPGAARELDFRLKKTLLVVEGKMDVPRRELRKHFTVSSLKMLSSVAGGVEEIKRSRASLIVVVGRDSTPELSHLERAVTGLKLPWAALRGRSGPVVYSVLHGQRPVIVIRANGDRELIEAFARLGRAKRIDAKAPFLAPTSDKA